MISKSKSIYWHTTSSINYPPATCPASCLTMLLHTQLVCQAHNLSHPSMHQSLSQCPDLEILFIYLPFLTSHMSHVKGYSSSKTSRTIPAWIPHRIPQYLVYSLISAAVLMIQDQFAGDNLLKTVGSLRAGAVPCLSLKYWYFALDLTEVY